MADSLDVYVNDSLAGTLRQAQGGLSFAYEPGWIASDAFVPLSITMPPRTEVYPDDIARPYFENLLPEGEIRAAIAKLKQVSEKNTYGLLEEIGGDCAGAISLCPHGDRPREHGGYAPLGDQRLAELLAGMDKRPLIMGDTDARLSLAGAQSKLPVYYDGTTLSLPRGSAPSSHILKPGSRAYAHMPVNEHFCMRLAHALAIPVPATEVLQKPDAIYLVERYDRKKTGTGALERVQQIDFCQALNLPSSRKYEKEGGPGLEQCFELVARESSQPAADRLRMIDWVIFNVLIGNADAHGKNLSLLLTPEGIRLAPFYDLISTSVYPGLTPDMAMKIGGEHRPEWIQERHWDAFAGISGASPRLIRARMKQLSTGIVDTARGLLAKLAASKEEASTLEKICAGIAGRARRIAAIPGP